VREHAPPRQDVTNPSVQLQVSAGDDTEVKSTPAEQPEPAGTIRSLLETFLSEAAQASSIQVRPASDIQAILTVLGRRDETARKQDQAARRRLDLVAIDLRGANLREAHLERADLTGADLQGAYLTRVHLESARLRGAYLGQAHLQNASLLGAHLQNARLRGADLKLARFWGADLQGAYLGADFREALFRGANLRKTRLQGADLRGAVGLTREQLALAFGDATTKVEDELRPPHWPATAPDRPDNPRQRA
jgi:uncharacterized protein YjbI with pentapeptide repeats